MIVILDYGVGNLASIQNMLKKTGATSKISSEKQDLLEADKIILPGVGAFDNCVAKLEQSGLKEALIKKVITDKVPVLGICVGMQLMLAESEEGALKGLNWIGGKVIRFSGQQIGPAYKIPHMGWTEIKATAKTTLLKGIENDPRFYFVHSYYVRLDDPANELFKATYGNEFTAGIHKDNIYGVQFHPEKSHRFGMKLLENFANNI